MDAVRERAEGLEREVERLTEECGVARDEVKGLKYQLSSATMELQQTKEVQLKEDPPNKGHLSIKDAWPYIMLPFNKGHL